MVEKFVVVLSRNRTSRSENDWLEKQILAGLEVRKELEVAVVPHLYDLAGDGPSMEFFRSVTGDMILLSWLYPRSAYWVLSSHGIEGRLGQTSSLPEEAADSREEAGQRTLWCLDLRDQKRPEPFLEEIDRIVAACARPVAESHWTNGRPRYVEETTSPRWYPVIDFSRCGQCLECLNFCLFGVFAVDDQGKLAVEQPDACRPGCPACSRICPAGAIMFPQHDDPAIAGDPKAAPGTLKLDLSQLFRGLDPVQVAEAERRRALAEQERQAATGGTEPVDTPGLSNLDDLVNRIDDMEL